MTTVASSLLDFILSLFSDDEAADRYAKDPEGELERAGLHGVKPADVDAVKNMETDYSPVSYRGHGRDHDCDDDKGHHGPVRHDGEQHHGHGHGHGAPVRHDDEHDHDDKCDWDDKRDDCDDDHKDHDGHRGNHEHHGGQETAVIQHIENNYTDIDIEHLQIAGGDAYAIWGEDVVLATGGSVAAGDDVKGVSIDNSTTDVDVDVDIKDSFNGSFNTDNSTTTNTATNSFNEDTNIADRGGKVEDNDVDVEVDDVTIVNDSFNGNTLAGGDVTTTEVEVEDIEDSAVNVGVAGDDVENEATDVDSEIENSIVGQNAVGGEEAENEFEYEQDNSVTLDVEIDDIVTGDNSAGDDLEQEVEIEDNLVVVVDDTHAAA